MSTPKKLKRHDRVYITSLKDDGIILERLNNNYYSVTVHDVAVRVHVSDIAPPRPDKRSKLPRKKKTAIIAAKTKKNASTKLDLHGLTREEATRALESHINRAIMDGVDRVEVVHGIGTGRVREAVLAYLQTLSVVESFKPDPFNPGVTWVYL